MKPNIFQKFSRWRVARALVAVVLVVVLGMMLIPSAMPSAVANAGGGMGGDCTATADNFTICKDTTIDNTLFTDHGVTCCDTCTMVIDHSGVDGDAVGTYTYTVTCTDGDCVDMATGTVTVVGCVLVDIIECPGCPLSKCGEEPRIVAPCTDFGVKAKITNDTGEVQCVTAELIIDNYANTYARPVTTPSVNLGWMDPGEVNIAAWTVHCEMAGVAEIKIKTDKTNQEVMRKYNPTYDICLVDQYTDPCLTVVLEGPCEVCTNCEDYQMDEFVLTATVTNNGDCGVVDGEVEIFIAGGTGSASLKTGMGQSLSQDLPYLEPTGVSGNSATVQWVFVCDSQGDVGFETITSGFSVCDYTPVSAPTEDTWTVCQWDTLVDILCVKGLTTDLRTDPLKGQSKYMPACNDNCLMDGSGAMYDVVSTEQMFMVRAEVMNCTPFQKDMWARLVIPDITYWNLITDSKVQIYCPTTDQEFWVDPNICSASMPTYVEVLLDDLCNCCSAEITWYLECLKADGDPTKDDIVVEVTDQGTSNCLWGDYSIDPLWSNTNCDCNLAYITQVDKAHLIGCLKAYVDDCDPCEAEQVNTVAVGQEYDVMVCIENTGDALAKDVYINLTVNGPTTCHKQTPYTDLSIGNVPGNDTVCKWLSELIQCQPECNGEGTTMVIINDIWGEDDNTCEPVLAENIDIPCPLEISQCDFEVEIINPKWCEDWCYGDVFSVKAQIRNCGSCDFEAPQKVELMWDGPGDVELLTTGMPNPYRMGDIMHNPCLEGDCTMPPCTTPELTWNVRCIKPGDVTFHVCVETAANWTGLDPQDVRKHLQVLDITEDIPGNEGPATVHQKMPPDVTVEILSPADDFTFIGTSQEFAVTAEIFNETSWGCDSDLMEFPVTITDVELVMDPANASILEDPFSEPIQIAAGGSQVLTWTLVCDKSGMMAAEVIVTAETEAVCHVITEESQPIILWQYPAAHLDVEILSVTPSTSINVCDEFTVNYKVTNTGEADATEVEAFLSVVPEGSARPIAGIGSGYSVDIGTLAGHEQDGDYYGSWNMHCKEACESTLNITAAGFDEYGWHQKQQCQSTGYFDITDGEIRKFEWCEGGDRNGASGYEGIRFEWEGEATGLIGPCIIESEVEFRVDNNIPPPEYTCGTGLLSLYGNINPNGSFEGEAIVKEQHICGDPNTPYAWEGTIYLRHGELTVINGAFYGKLKGNLESMPIRGGDGIPITILFNNGTYCSTMASTPLLEIPDKFIEDASVTVKQLPASTDLEITKIVPIMDYDYDVGEPVTFMVTVENLGPSDATDVMVRDIIPSGLNYTGSSGLQGWYDVGSGIWDVGDIADGDSAWLQIDATVTKVGVITNQAIIIGAAQPDPATNNNMAMVSITGLALPPVEDANVDLVNGYNLISLPLIPYDEDLEDVLSDVISNVDRVDMYEADETGVGTWNTWYTGTLPPDSLFTMEDGWGYWVDYSGSPMAFNFGGWEFADESDPLIPPPSYDVYNGWNLIGFKSTAPKAAAEYLAGIAGKYVMIYGFDGTSYFVVGSPGHESFEPGFGYWLAVVLELGETGTIYP